MIDCYPRVESLVVLPDVQATVHSTQLPSHNINLDDFYYNRPHVSSLLWPVTHSLTASLTLFRSVIHPLTHFSFVSHSLTHSLTPLWSVTHPVTLQVRNAWSMTPSSSRPTSLQCKPSRLFFWIQSFSITETTSLLTLLVTSFALTHCDLTTPNDFFLGYGVSV